MKFINVQRVKPVKPITNMQDGWKELNNMGATTQWASITFNEALFFWDHFTPRQSSSGLLEAIHASGTPIPDGKNDLERLNSLLRQRGLHQQFSDYTFSNKADRLIKKGEATLSEPALIQLNRYVLESVFPECPRSLTAYYPLTVGVIEGRLEHFFKKLNTLEQAFFLGTIYILVYYEKNKSRAGYHIHCFITGIDRSLSSALERRMRYCFGDCDVCPHYEHGVIFERDFPSSFNNLPEVLSKLLAKGWLTLINYQGKPGYAVNQSVETIRDALNEEFPLDAAIIIQKILGAKDGARYVSKKDPTEYLGFNLIPVTGRKPANLKDFASWKKMLNPLNTPASS